MTIHKKFIYSLIIIAAVALLLRLGVSSELAGFNHGFNSVLRPSQATDMCTYRDLAAKIATGKWEGEFYYQPFYYAVFLPSIRILFGDSIWAVITVQALLGAITVYLTGLCAAMLWNRASGIMAALLVTFSEALLLYTPYHLIGTLQAFWVTLLLYLAIKALNSRKLIYWTLTGLCAGCGILTRGNIWFIVPGLFMVAIISLNNSTCGNWVNKKNRFKIIAALILFSVMLLLPQLPFAWHNST
ncbi:MAG: glycosyltransferase family 39 protein, partial [Victivallaceae bacterium]